MSITTRENASGAAASGELKPAKQQAANRPYKASVWINTDSRKDAFFQHKGIHTISAYGWSHMEVIRHLSKYIRSHRPGDMLAIYKCDSTLADDLESWCQLQNQPYHYCANNCVFGLIVGSCLEME